MTDAQRDQYVDTLENQLAHYKAQDEAVRARTPYKQFCKHPAICANTGRCQAEYCCID